MFPGNIKSNDVFKIEIKNTNSSNICALKFLLSSRANGTFKHFNLIFPFFFIRPWFLSFFLSSLFSVLFILVNLSEP